MEASTSNDPDVKTFRGRSLEEMLPQIREELGSGRDRAAPPRGSDRRGRRLLPAPVRRGRRARARSATSAPLEIRSDRATAEGLSSPAVQALFEQATPFADALAAAARDTSPQDDFFSATVSDDRRLEPRWLAESLGRVRRGLLRPGERRRSTGLYGPQPNQDAIRRAAPKPPAPEPEAKAEPAIELPPPGRRPSRSPSRSRAGARARARSWSRSRRPELDESEAEDGRRRAAAFTFDAPTGFAIPRAPRPRAVRARTRCCPIARRRPTRPSSAWSPPA